mgnify:CR=1 FL=1
MNDMEKAILDMIECKYKCKYTGHIKVTKLGLGGTGYKVVFDFDNHAKGAEQEDYANIDDRWKEEINALRRICKNLDVDAVVETKRGHHLGRVLWTGSAAPNTGIPGLIGGYGKERVIHCPAKGIVRNVKKITDTVSKGDVIALVETEDGEIPVKATLDGILRGLIRDGYPVKVGFKMADIDPRAEEIGNCFTISDKARCIAGGVLEAILQRKGELSL